jgi:two-component system chemotaxis response regulator CheY
MRILVVDDQASIRSLVKEILQSIKIRDVTEASNGAVALQKLRGSPPFDLMICDWNMPEMNGIELVKAVRSDDSLFALRVLMLTSEQSRENILKIAALKVQGYVVKPFKPDILAKAVAHSLTLPLPTLIPAQPPQEPAGE